MNVFHYVEYTYDYITPQLLETHVYNDAPPLASFFTKFDATCSLIGKLRTRMDVFMSLAQMRPSLLRSSSANVVASSTTKSHKITTCQPKTDLLVQRCQVSSFGSRHHALFLHFRGNIELTHSLHFGDNLRCAAVLPKAVTRPILHSEIRN